MLLHQLQLYLGSLVTEDFVVASNDATIVTDLVKTFFEFIFSLL
jgi:hypothetical protein